jgi:hypothetical protein
MDHRWRTASRRHHLGHGRSAPTRAREREPALLELQRLAGNRAVAGLLVPVQRSCCGGCASGGSCEQDDATRARPAVALQRAYTNSYESLAAQI